MVADRVLSVSELAERAYEDTHRQFIEPVGWQRRAPRPSTSSRQPDAVSLASRSRHASTRGAVARPPSLKAPRKRPPSVSAATARRARSRTQSIRDLRSLIGESEADRSPLVLRSQELALEQFRRAAAIVPFYKRLLAARGIRPRHVDDIETFRAVVPIIEKSDVFGSHQLGDLVVAGSLDDIETLITSSGLTASSFSLGMINRRGTQSMIRSTDRLLDHLFHTRDKKTFVINTCAMGVTIPTSLPGINLSVRSDKALALLKALKPYYRQFVVTSDVYFLKKLLEDGCSAGMRWSNWPVQFIMGGEWFPETYRQYLASLLHVDLNRPHPSIHILGSMGAAELGFNLCFETHDVVRLRRLAASDDRVREALFGPIETLPMIGHYDPRRWFVEVMPTQELGANGGAFAFTTLDPDMAMPLVRYQTGDCGYILSHRRVSGILRALHHEAYIPALTHPLIAVVGRTKQSLTVARTTVRMEFLRTVLYSDPALAATTTGQFNATTKGGRLRLRVQLQADVEPGLRARIQAQWSSLFNRHFPAVVHAIPYFEFREALSVDYERKFLHLMGGA
jgi:phenylacetate-CoA ligase